MALSMVPTKGQHLEGERNLFSSSDDTAMMKQIQATHAPDGRQVDLRPLVHIIEDIFHRAAPPTILGIIHSGSQAQLDALEDKAFQTDFNDMLELLAYTINRISCEISCKCSNSGDAHETTLSLFNTLANYSWDAKAVIALGAFAVNYGEFWMVAQFYPTSALAKSVAIIKQLPEIMERADSLKPKFDALINLIKAMMDLTKCIIEFKELPSQYISHETPEFATATAHIPTAVYWIIRSVVACASQIMGLVGMGHEYITSTTEAWELSSLAHKVSNIHNHLKNQLALCYHHIGESLPIICTMMKKKRNTICSIICITLAHKVSNIHNHLKNQLALCYRHIDEKRHIEAYQTPVRLFETRFIDNIKILKPLVYTKDVQLPLYDGVSKKRVSTDVLRRKNVLLLISDLDLSHEEIFILDQMYQESRSNPARPESHYEIVWLPVVDRSPANPWTNAKQQQFENLQREMPWYTVYHPSSLEPAVIKYIKEVWKFNKKPLLVVLDPQGRRVNMNALHMMRIWGSLAFPFTSLREEQLWKEESWRIELLVGSIEPTIFQWMADGKYICLYGGEDVEWIRQFTTTAKAVAQAAKVQLEMLYVGQSNPSEKIREINTLIKAENLSHVLPDLTLIWFFWVRLESMWHSKVQHGKSEVDDPIMQEIMTMLRFDGSDQGWVVICRGSTEMARGKADTIFKSLTDYEKWRDLVPEKGLVQALNDYLHELHTPNHCIRLIVPLIVPGTIGSLQETVICAECGREMEMFIMYRCYTD